MTADVTIINGQCLSNIFIGNRNLFRRGYQRNHRTIVAVVTLGVGPWCVNTFGPGNVTEQTRRSKAHPIRSTGRLRGPIPASVSWSNQLRLTALTRKEGEGVEHVAQSCSTLATDEQSAELVGEGWTSCSWEVGARRAGDLYPLRGTDRHRNRTILFSRRIQLSRTGALESAAAAPGLTHV